MHIRHFCYVSRNLDLTSGMLLVRPQPSHSNGYRKIPRSDFRNMSIEVHRPGSIFRRSLVTRYRVRRSPARYNLRSVYFGLLEDDGVNRTPKVSNRSPLLLSRVPRRRPDNSSNEFLPPLCTRVILKPESKIDHASIHGSVEL